LAKLTRLQYKSGQETQVKLEQLNQGLANVQQWQTEYDAKREYLLDILLCQLDEIDRAGAGLDDRENNPWQPLLQQWSQRMIAAVAELSLYEIDILGKTFEPQVAECVGAVIRVQETDTPVSYEVAEVVRRGFVNSEGRLLRKAQVITYEEA